MAVERTTTVPTVTSGDLDFTVHLEDGAFWATVAQIPGVFATGETLDELRECLHEGIAFVRSDLCGSSSIDD
jgi:predicted RNase H-like HicB family nuclease